MFQACVSFASSYLPETIELVRWMISMNLDFYNTTRLAAVKPVEVMVRGSLDLGVPRYARHYFSEAELYWKQETARVKDITSMARSREENSQFMMIHQLGNYTIPHVTPDEWASYFSKYTNGTYGGFDAIVHQPHTTKILRLLFESEHVGPEGLKYLVAWSILRQLADFTEPYLFHGGRNPTDVCYEHIKKVMNLAITSHFFELATRKKGGVLKKFDDIVINVGSPGRRLEPEFIEEYYKPYPDAPVNRLFPSWIKALSLSTHSLWSDQTAELYDESEVTARYFHDYNIAVIPTAIITRPFFYLDGPMAMNYGGLGMIIAHELMHAFDIRGIDSEPWATNAFMKRYTERALCLRKSHKSVLSLSRRQDMLNDTVDSENLADLVGTRIAYTAFTSLPAEHKAHTLAGLNMSEKQLFFIIHCTKFCAQYSVPSNRYAPFRSRCIVPLMNMREFSWAFGCPEGAPMNPYSKCDFWF
ncbi:hypothetical protein MRX96_006325 [Rhipicephalus microplus]